MPSKKRKQRAAAASAPSSRRNRRSPVPNTQGRESASKTQGSTESMSTSRSAATEDQAITVEMNKMHTIMHHTSFVPTIASLQLRNDPLHSSNHQAHSILPPSIKPGMSTKTTNHDHNPAKKSNVLSSTNNASSSNGNANTSFNYNRKRPYALYHPRNLGLQPPTIFQPPEGNGKVITPHSAGCRMKYLPKPTFRTMPVHPDFQSAASAEAGVSAGPTCPTVMSNCTSSSGQIAIGDTGGSITLYATLPSFLPIQKLSSSAHERFLSFQPKAKPKSKGSAGESTGVSTSAKPRKKPKRIGRGNAVVGSSIDRNNAIESILLLKEAQGVIVGTTREIECISFEDEIRWTWDLEYGWDAIEEKKMARGFPSRLHGDQKEDFVLASFGFFALRERAKKKEKADGNDDKDCDDGKTDEDANVSTDAFQNGNETKSEPGTCTLKPASEKPELYSPILKINVETGEFTNVLPLEQCKPNIENDPNSQDWRECHIGTRAMAIFDKLHNGNIVGVFITYRTSNDEVDASDAIQELMVLNSSYHILHRTTIPTKSSGTKLITVEAINQSPNGDFTMSANAKGGIRVYKTDGLQLLGAFGEGVSLHGHSIVWQNVFFVQIDKNSREEEDTATDGGQQQWGQILERTDEITHRGKYEQKRAKQNKGTDSLKELHVVSVPSAFREPVDMKEHIQFWDLSTLELDGGRKLPSFELLAPKKSEGICTLLFDDSIMTSNSGRFLMSTHAGDCLEMIPTLTTDWCGQMYPTGYLVLDNNLTYIEDEDELDQVVDSHIDQVGICQSVTNPHQSEVELELALQVSMMDEHIDVVGMDDENWRNSVTHVAPCRPEPHLRLKLQGEAKANNQGIDSSENYSSAMNVFDLMSGLPQFNNVKQNLLQDKEKAEQRIIQIEDTKLKMTQEPVKVPRRKQGNIDYIIREAVDKCLTIRMLEKEGPGDGSGSILKDEGTKKGNETIAATVLPLESTSVDCPACRGRFVVHACGKRARPIDYDAIARAEKEKQEKVEAEKRRLLQERRKLAEKRRKEKKIKKREEERRLQKEMEMEAEDKEDESLPEASLDLTGNGDERPVASLDLTISENAAAPKYETLDLTKDENCQVENTDRMSSYRSASSHANTYMDSSHIDRNKYAENSRHHQYDYQETDHHSSYDYSQSSFHHHEGNGIHQATKSSIPDNHKQMDTRATNHSSYGSMNYGDSMLSNIPALPSEPSSYYRGGSMNVNLTGQNGDRSGTERN